MMAVAQTPVVARHQSAVRVARPANALAARRAVLPATIRSRGSLQVVAAKGGEEGGKAFGKDIVGTLSAHGDFNILASLITKAGLGAALSAPGPFTVFAPNDDAFAAAAKKLGTTKMGLMSLPNLGDILKYHVVSGAVLSTDLKEGMDAATLQGKTVKVTLAGGAKINGIAVKKADAKAANGVIHVLDGVLIP